MIREKIKNYLQQSIELESINDSDTFEMLGLDSLDYTLFIGWVCEEFDIDYAFILADKNTRIIDVIEYVKNNIKKKF